MKIQKIVLLSGVIASFSAIPSYAYEYKETHGHAAVTDAEIAAVSYGAGQGLQFLGEHAPAATTKVLQDTELGQPLTAQKIEEILAAVKKSPTSFWKVGDLGGGQLKVVLDLNQYDQYITAQNADHMTRGRGFAGQYTGVHGSFKPRWGEISNPINVAKSGIEGVRAQLEQILASGARVQKISLQSLASRSLLPGGLHALGIASIVPSVTHLVSSLYHGAHWAVHQVTHQNDTVCRPQSHCQEPGLVQKSVLSSAPLPSWVPYPGGAARDAR